MWNLSSSNMLNSVQKLYEISLAKSGVLILKGDIQTYTILKQKLNGKISSENVRVAMSQ